MARITIHNATEITAEGNRTRGNAKAVFCITTGDIYASATDAAEILGCAPSSVSWVATGRMKQCKGLRLCYVANITEHLEEIAECARARQTKVTAYDAIIAEQKTRANAQANYEKAMARREKLRQSTHHSLPFLPEAFRVLP